MSGPGTARFLLISGLLSVALHALVLVIQPGQEQRPVPVTPARRGGGSLLVRTQPSEEAAGGLPTGEAARASESAKPSPHIPSSEPASRRPGIAADPVADGDYVPRPQLSVAPQPQQPVMLTWPDFDGAKQRYEGVLALYIDEHGVVQRVRVLEGDLPPELEAQARAVFSATRFSPGQLDGVAVRSRVLVEVAFEKPDLPRSSAHGLGR